MAWRCDDCKPFWSGVEIPTRMQIFFSLIFVQIHTNEVIHIIVRIRIRCGFCTNSYNFLYDLYITNSYNDNFLYELYSTISYNDNILYELYSTNSYNEPRARSASREGRSPSREGEAQAARAKPEHTSCPDQAAPGCPDVRVHPAAPTFRVHPAAPTLGYTRLP
jgi:hypothetical protein